MMRTVFTALLVLVLATPALAGEAFDHAAWDQLLRAHVRGDGLDYEGLRAKEAQLDLYLAAIAATDPNTLGGRPDRLAFYLNAYNAYTVKAVLAAGPALRSVADVAPDFGFFKAADKTVGGKKVSLNDLENTIIRPTFKDPRIHAALNCASKSCPPLLAEAFVPAHLERQLEGVMRAFARDEARNHIAPGDVKLSRIFEWYAADFGPEGPKPFLARYLEGPRAEALHGAANLGYLDYDWRLNRP